MYLARFFTKRRSPDSSLRQVQAHTKARIPNPDTTLESLWKTYNIINEWIKFADAKAIGVLTINGIIATIALANLGSGIEYLRTHQGLLYLLCLGILTELISIFYSVRCLAPVAGVNMPNQELKLEHNSVIFFSDIAKHPTAQAYLDKALQSFGDEDQLLRQVSYQIWTNSKIVKDKFADVRVSTWALSITLIVATLSILAIAFS